MVVQAGAGADSPFIQKYEKEMKKGLQDALKKGLEVLRKQGTAIDAVEAAIKELENNWYFNAGRGSAINAKGEVEMCASIIEGKTRASGAVAIVKNVKNPISLAKAIMKNTSFVYLGAEGALDYAKKIDIDLAPDSYFVTPHQYDEFEKQRKQEFRNLQHISKEQINQRMHGTVGAVAIDHEGNLAAGTSTGGTPNAKEGRIGDSSMIGVGSFADNQTCALSSTGDGEYLIRGVVCHSISQAMKYRKIPLKDACKQVIHVDNKDAGGDMGVIGIDKNGNVAMDFNCDRLLRAWKEGNKPMGVKIYK